MKASIIKILWTGILTLTVVGSISLVKGEKENSAVNIVLLQEEQIAKRVPATESEKSEGKTIVFNYTHKGKPLKLTFKGTTWETALKEGANKCMDYYTDGLRAKVDEELYLDLIDVCVNPR